MVITYGCECKCRVHQERSAASAPCVKLVRRKGQVMQVCSRCMLNSDEVLAYMVDKNGDSDPFYEYDALGAMVISMDMISGEEGHNDVPSLRSC